MQMAKTSAAASQAQREGDTLYIRSYRPDYRRCYGKLRYARGCDNRRAQGAYLLCRAPRVIEQTIGGKLPEGFQRSEFLLEHGMIDMIVERKNLKGTLSKVISILTEK